MANEVKTYTWKVREVAAVKQLHNTLRELFGDEKGTELGNAIVGYVHHCYVPRGNGTYVTLKFKSAHVAEDEE